MTKQKKEEQEPQFCIYCGKQQTVKDITTGCGRTEPQCQDCGNLLGTTPVRCLSIGEKGCKGDKLFLPLRFPSMDFEHTTHCPLCGQVGQFVEIET